MNWSKIPSKENGTHDFISSASCSIMISISGFSPASFTNSPFNGDTWRPFYGVAVQCPDPLQLESPGAGGIELIVCAVRAKKLVFFAARFGIVPDRSERLDRGNPSIPRLPTDTHTPMNVGFGAITMENRPLGGRVECSRGTYF